MRFLALIPARGGSKGVPRKNVAMFCGRPLIAWTIAAARGSGMIARTVVSTDDPEIAGVARHFGADVPFVRPKDLSNDKAPTLPVVVHALLRLEEFGEKFDAVCLLQPTNPLRRTEDIDAAIAAFAVSGADSLVSVRPVPHEYNPKWVFFNCGGRLRLATGEPEPVSRRQDLPEAYHRDGSIYVTRAETILARGSLYGEKIAPFLSDERYSVNIDTPADWTRAEELFQSNVRNIGNGG